MDTRLAKDILNVIRSEQRSRASLLAGKDPDFAYDHWLFTDAPFVNELCLMLLVALRHQVERELIAFAARAADDGKEIDRRQYQQRMKELQKQPTRPRWKTIEDRLQLKLCEEHGSIEALRLLANSYKHNPSKQPNEDLLNQLKLKIDDKYAPLHESGDLQEGLALSIGLEKDADYCDIAERFLDVVDLFLADVQKRTRLSRVRWGAASLNPDEFAH